MPRTKLWCAKQWRMAQANSKFLLSRRGATRDNLTCQQKSCVHLSQPFQKIVELHKPFLALALTLLAQLFQLHSVSVKLGSHSERGETQRGELVTSLKSSVRLKSYHLPSSSIIFPSSTESNCEVMILKQGTHEINFGEHETVRNLAAQKETKFGSMPGTPNTHLSVSAILKVLSFWFVAQISAAS